MNGYVVLVASLVLYLFDVGVDCLVFVVNCMLVCQKRLILILILFFLFLIDVGVISKEKELQFVRYIW